MLIRKNTKAFKTIRQLIEMCKDRSDREKLVRLYITKAGHTINDRISIEGIQGDTSFFYDMNYQTILSNLDSANHQLHVSDDVAGIYFFHSTSNKVWDEVPFEFDEAILEEFNSLQELPAVRKKEKVEKYVFPTPANKQQTSERKKPKTEAKKSVTKKPKGPEQPRFKLKQDIIFTNLEKTVYRKDNVTKLDLLNYYNGVAEYILPYLKNRLLWSRLTSRQFGESEQVTSELLFGNNTDDVPRWMNTSPKLPSMMINDKEHLLLFVEQGLVQFDISAASVKNDDKPDYIIISIDSPESNIGETVVVANIAREIFEGLALPSFVQSDGFSGLHLYVPLDSKSSFDHAGRVALYICKLISLRVPNTVALKDSDDKPYGKVTLDWTLNHREHAVVAPYSLLYHESPTIATPVLWDEVNEDLRPEAFAPQMMLKRLQRVGDPFEKMFRKKINAKELLNHLDKHYSFLFDEAI